MRLARIGMRAGELVDQLVGSEIVTAVYCLSGVILSCVPIAPQLRIVRLHLRACSSEQTHNRNQESFLHSSSSRRQHSIRLSTTRLSHFYNPSTRFRIRHSPFFQKRYPTHLPTEPFVPVLVAAHRPSQWSRSDFLPAGQVY